MQLPANLQGTLINITTNAVANTSTVTNLIAGPGPGYRWRLWRMEVVNVQNAAAQVLRFYAREIGTGIYRGHGIMQLGTKGIIDWSTMGGIVMSTNAGLAIETFDTLAAQTAAVFSFYTLEAA